MLLKNPSTYSLFAQRRKALQRKAFARSVPGVILLAATYEEPRNIFKQESSFYYFTGVSEPGAILALYSDGKEILYIPNFGAERAKWVNVQLAASVEDNGAWAKKMHLDAICYLGKQKQGYSLSAFFDALQYQHLINDLQEYQAQNPTAEIFTLRAPNNDLYTVPYHRLSKVMEHLASPPTLHDIAFIVHEMRRTKDPQEIKFLQQAVDITIQAHLKAAQVIKHGVKEYQVRADIERTFIYEGALGPSFPSIVATGKNTTVLHYTELNQTLQQGDLVVVDIGALYGYYAADLTRTFPVGGSFSPRQREIYNVVLETQMYAAQLARPGMFLRNPEEPEKSLHDQAVQFLKNKGLDKYFVHGLGHFLGLDVHDVGNVRIPLREGDVFTIEPGVYLPDEGIGVRIEDDYVITADGCRCLSEALPKKSEDIEEMMRLA